ncbi:DUF1080 domain-containing protein [candidate division KSB1 bacterium]
MIKKIKLFTGLLLSLFIILSNNTFCQTTKQNTLTSAEINAGWKLLFDGKTSNNWTSSTKEVFPEKGWKIENGELVVVPGGGGGDIVTEKKYSSFELSLEFKMVRGANSGIKYFVQPKTSIGLEYQILDDDNHPDADQGVGGNRKLASLYDLIPAEDKNTKPVGEWNQARIIVNGNHIEHWLNGKKVVEFERSTQIYRALVAKSKYKDYENFGMHQNGHILLQDHGDNVAFRNIKIRELTDK